MGNVLVSYAIIGLIVLLNLFNFYEMFKLYDHCYEVSSKPFKNFYIEYFVEDFNVRNNFGKIFLFVRYFIISFSIVFAMLYIAIANTIQKTNEIIKILTTKK